MCGGGLSKEALTRASIGSCANDSHVRPAMKPALTVLILLLALAPARASAEPFSWFGDANVPQASRSDPPPEFRSTDPAFLPAIVRYATKEAPGTIVIDTNARYLYLVMEDGKARRYGVGVGRPGFEWAGVHTVTRKAEWPAWRPPAEMIAREEARGRIIPAFMEGGPDNPLGARAMYLGSSLYRIHGSNEPWTIGQAVSSGCIRMRNEDVMDLYERVHVGTRVIVI